VEEKPRRVLKNDTRTQQTLTCDCASCAFRTQQLANICSHTASIKFPN